MTATPQNKHGAEGVTSVAVAEACKLLAPDLCILRCCTRAIGAGVDSAFGWQPASLCRASSACCRARPPGAVRNAVASAIDTKSASE